MRHDNRVPPPLVNQYLLMLVSPPTHCRQLNSQNLIPSSLHPSHRYIYHHCQSMDIPRSMLLFTGFSLCEGRTSVSVSRMGVISSGFSMTGVRYFSVVFYQWDAQTDDCSRCHWHVRSHFPRFDAPQIPTLYLTDDITAHCKHHNSCNHKNSNEALIP